jgi:hypothetical protein
MTWIGNDMSYAVQGAACVQHFTKRP